MAEASDRLMSSLSAIFASADFTPGFTRNVSLDDRISRASLFCTRALAVSDTERRSPFVPGAGWDEAGGAIRRMALSCHLRKAERSPSPDAPPWTTVVFARD